MGLSDKLARIAANQVLVTSPRDEDGVGQAPVGRPPSPTASSVPSPSSVDPPLSQPLATAPPSPVVVPPVAPGGAAHVPVDASSITAVLERLVAVQQHSLSATLAAFQTQSVAQAEQYARQFELIHSRLATLAPTSPPAHELLPRLSTPPIPSSPSPAALPDLVAPPVSIAPHRSAAFGAGPAATTAVNDLIDQAISSSASGASQQTEVNTQSHTSTSSNPQRLTAPSSTPSSPLPEAFIPQVAGSVRDNTQLLLNLITTFHKKEVKYSSLTELDAALDEWWDSAVTNGWTSTQLNSLAQYKRLLTVTWKDNPFSAIREYHKLWTKAVHSGRHDMFQVDGHIHLACMINAKINPNASPSTISHGKKPQKSSQADATKSGETVKKGTSAAGRYPAGSCTNHPDSTTHKTEECRRK